MWQCKECQFTTNARANLSSHYKLKHAHGPNNPHPCLYFDCPCTFRTETALRSHLSRSHSNEETCHRHAGEILTFNCHICRKNDISTQRDYLRHIYKHLKNHETVSCIYKHCNFKSNIYGTFKSHKSRTHGSHKT